MDIARLVPARRRLATLMLLVVACTLASSGCGMLLRRELRGSEVAPPASFDFLGDMSRCYLELSPGAEAFPVNCFALDGVLHIHTGRYAKLPRWSGENWAVTVRREPHVRVEHEEKIYALRAVVLDDDARRQEILHDRGYWRAWDGITVVRFVPRETGR